VYFNPDSQTAKSLLTTTLSTKASQSGAKRRCTIYDSKFRLPSTFQKTSLACDKSANQACWRTVSKVCDKYSTDLCLSWDEPALQWRVCS